jgi:hypothetical protein
VNDLFNGSKQLQNHPTVSYGAGAGAILFGLPFLGVGVFMTLVGFGAVSTDPADVHAPLWLLGVFGLVFGIPGALIISAGVRGLIARQRRRAALARNPDEPWRADHAWDERASRDRASNPLGYFGMAAFMTLFLSLFNYFVFTKPDVPIMIKGLIGLFDLVLVALWLCAFYVLGRRLKYGSTRVRLSTFPFLVGHPLKVTVELPAALRDFPELRATFRLVEQVWETRGAGKNRSQQLISYERWGEEQVIPRDRIGRELGLEFDVPAGAPATDLTGAKARYWELQLDAETPGIDFHGLFLLPVY